MENRSASGRLNFRPTGAEICLFGIALAVVSLATTLLLGRFWMMTLLAPLPLLGFGLSMRDHSLTEPRNQRRRHAN